MIAALWVLLTVTAGVAGWRAWRAGARPSREAVVVFLGALILRWFVAPGMPQDVNTRLKAIWAGGGIPEGGPDVVRSPAQQTLAWGLRQLVGIDEPTFFHLTALFGALSTAALVAWARPAVGRGPAVAAGAILAILGIHARLSHTDSPQILGIALLHGALAWWVLGRDRWTWIDGAGVASALALASMCRPEDIVVVPAFAVLVVALRTPGERWGPLVATVAAAAMLSGAWIVDVVELIQQTKDLSPSAAPGASALDRLPWSLVWVDPWFTSPAVGLGVVLSLAAAAYRSWPVRLALPVLAATVVWALVTTAWTTEGGTLLSVTRHQLRAYPFVALATSVGWGWLVATLPARWRIAGWAGVLLAIAPSARFTWLPTVQETEYQLIVDTVLELERTRPGCRVLVPPNHCDIALGGVDHLDEMWDLDLQVDMLWWGAPEVVDPEGCTVMVRGLICSHARTRRSCEVDRETTSPFPLCDASFQGSVLVPLREVDAPQQGWGLAAQEPSTPVVMGAYEVRPVR